MTQQKPTASLPTNGERNKALLDAMRQIEKHFGHGAVMFLGQQTTEPIDVISTGSMALNAALGIGGYPRGRIVEIYGSEASGKTTLALHAIAEVQRAGGTALFVDAEHAFDPHYAARLGIDVKALLVAQPDCGEDALDIADTLIRSAAIDLVVVDSVAALTPKAELEGEMGDNKLGLQARLMSQALRKITASLAKTRTTCLFINQLREKINVPFGNPEVTTGGNALKFYASQRVDIRRIGQIKVGDDILGNRTKIKVVKNKIAPPFRIAEFDIMYNEGISKTGDILDLAATHGIVEKSGAFYKYNGETIGQGRDKTKLYLKENPEVLAEIDQKVRDKVKEADS